MKEATCTQCGTQFEKPKGYKIGNLCSFKCRDVKYYFDKPRKSYNKYRTFNCEVCGDDCKVIDDYRVKGISINKLCKKKECKKENQRLINNKINEKERDKLHIANKDNINHYMDNFFMGKESLYSDKIVECDVSPTGKAYIGLAKAPLIPNDNGIGYKGVLLQSENRTLVQCSECGKWYKNIPTRHLEAHGLTREKYKEKYGLNKTQALVSDTYSRFYASNIVEVVNNRGIVNQEQREEWCKKGREVMQKNREKKYNTDQMKNDKGTCDLQLKHRFIKYIIGHHKYPPANKYPYPSLRDRFGSTNNALKTYGLPTRKQIGYTVLYEFADGYTFKILKGKGYEELFHIMQLKCPIMNDNIINT